jgi:hypothetical protein
MPARDELAGEEWPETTSGHRQTRAEARFSRADELGRRRDSAALMNSGGGENEREARSGEEGSACVGQGEASWRGYAAAAGRAREMRSTGAVPPPLLGLGRGGLAGLCEGGVRDARR